MFMRGYTNHLIAISLFCFTLTGCGKGVQFGIAGTSQSFTQNGSTVKNAIDILFVVDNSGSMSPLQANLTSNFSAFIANFAAQGYDFHIAVTTTDAYKSEANFANDPTYAKFSDGVAPTLSGIFDILSTTPNIVPTFVTNASTGSNGSGDERAFSSFRDALNSAQNTGFLRTNSFLAVIILSDEDDFSSSTRGEGLLVDHCYGNAAMDTIAEYSNVPATAAHIASCAAQTPPDSVASYETYLDTLTQSTGATRRYNVNTIAVLDTACLAIHQPAATTSIIGQRYIQMANDTKGITGSICDASYATSLEAISNQITVLSTEFPLNRVPQITTIVISVNGNVVPQDPTNGWTYDSAANAIQFHGSATPAQNATINVAFTPVSIAG